LKNPAAVQQIAALFTGVDPIDQESGRHLRRRCLHATRLLKIPESSTSLAIEIAVPLAL